MHWKKKYDPVAESLAAKDKHSVNGAEYTHPYKLVRELSRLVDQNAIICGDLGGVSVIIAHALDTKTGQRYFSSNGNAPMGYSFAGAIGAWIAAPDRQVIALIGDGGMNMNIQELQTLINYQVKVKTFILNNHIYGITKAYQLTNFHGRTEACGPEGYNPPDFVRIADAYGIKTFSINNDEQIEQIVKETLSYDGPAVCDVNM
ncbi:MAG: thiamine pyrophosphate-dependent enzyme, partial [Coleofasciculus sp. C2-GNP5-27]